MKHLKHILCGILVCLLVLALLPAPQAEAASYSGKCGTNAYWNLDSDSGILTISGSGDIYDFYSDTTMGWNEWKHLITSVQIGSGITGIGNNTFNRCYNITQVTIPNSVTRIGSNAFFYCHLLTEITIPSKVSKIESKAFANCTALSSITFRGDAPQFADDCFLNVSTVAYYPQGNGTWTGSVRKDYGGSITWMSKCYHTYKSVVTKPTCTQQGYTTHTCSICGSVYVDSYVSAKGHSWDAGTVIKAPTSTQEGEKLFRCTVCNSTKTETIPISHTHEYEAVETKPTCTEQGYTTYTCKTCGTYYRSNYKSPLGHRWSEPNVLKEPSETETGLREYTCTRCGYVRTEVVPVLPHEHKYSFTVTPPSCLDQGYTTYYCECGDTYDAEFVPALGHAFDEKNVCYRCGYTDSEPGPTGPTDPTEPTSPTDPTKPSSPVDDPTNPGDPTDDPTNPGDSTEPTSPTESEPAGSTGPTAPTAPKPVVPVEDENGISWFLIIEIAIGVVTVIAVVLILLPKKKKKQEKPVIPSSQKPVK